MASVEVSSSFAHPRKAVWEVFADIGNVHEISAGIVGSQRENKKAGKGAMRSCDFGKGKGILEEVTIWDKHQKIEFTGKEIYGVPMKSVRAVFTFTDEAPQGSRVDVRMEFEMKGGPLMNWIAKGQMRKALAQQLAGADDKLTDKSHEK